MQKHKHLPLSFFKKIVQFPQFTQQKCKKSKHDTLCIFIVMV